MARRVGSILVYSRLQFGFSARSGKKQVSGLNHGGIALYARCGGIFVKHLQHSAVAERSWHVIHSDVGGILLGLWYRPPGAGANDIESFEDELSRLSIDTIGALVIGDMNILQKSWLKYSPADTVDGANLHRICKEHNLKQLVLGPTRGANLLDLALSFPLRPLLKSCHVFRIMRLCL